VIPCDAALQRGEEMGWFEHGSTIIALAPPGFRLGEGVSQGARVQMGQALLRTG
jgi:phosphatidylserine decarboxylase